MDFSAIELSEKPGLTATVPVNYRLSEEFEYYRRQWKRRTATISFVDLACSDYTYRKIIDLGQGVIPLILQSMESEPDYWLNALEELTKDDPVKESHYGDLKAMNQDWIEWGRQRNLI